MIRMIPLYVLFSLASIFSSAQVSVDSPGTAAEIDSLVRNLLADASIEVQSVTVEGNINAIGIFSASNDFPLSTGIIMSTGLAVNAPVGVGIGNNTSFGLIGDQDIDALLQGVPSADAFSIIINFIPTGNELNLEYIFASIDYGTYECSQFTDMPGFFLSGPGVAGPFSNNAINLAAVPNKPDVPVCINTINAGVAGPNGSPPNCFSFDPDWVSNSLYFAGLDDLLSYTGRTEVLSSLVASVIPGESYTLKLVIADASDAIFDSAIFLKGGGLSSDNEATSDTIMLDTLLCGVTPILLSNGAIYDDYTIGENTDTVVYVNGLDTLTYILNIIALETPVTEIMLALCPGESIEIDGVTISEPGEYPFVYSTTPFCDSTVIYTVDYLEEIVTHLFDTTCVLAQAGTYTSLFTSTNGCDSTVILEVTLSENLASVNVETYHVCEGDTLSFEGQSYTSDTTWQELIIAGGGVNGCDSLREVRIRFTNHDYIVLDAIPEAICQGDTLEIIYGEDFTSEYQVSMIETRGDSLPLPDGNGIAYETAIVINSFPPGSVITDINSFKVCVNIEHSWMRDLEIRLSCPDGMNIILADQELTGGEVFLGEPFENDEGFPISTPGVGYTYCWTASGTHTWREYADEFMPSTLPEGNYASFESLDNLLGCSWNGAWELRVIDLWGADNGYIFNWSIGQETIQGLDTALVVSQGWLDHPNAQISGDTLQFIATEAGQYNFTYALEDSLGCVYDTTFLLLVDTSSLQEIDISLCTGADLEGINVDTSGTYTFVYPAISGCDSTLIYHVTTTGEIDTTFISTQSCRIDSTGIFETIYASIQGCDSVVVETISYIPPADTTIVPIIYTCEQANAGTFYDAFISSEGCDSIVLREVVYQNLELTIEVVGDTCEQGLGSIMLDVENAELWPSIDIVWLDANAMVVDTGLVADSLQAGIYQLLGTFGELCTTLQPLQLDNTGLNNISAEFTFDATDLGFVFIITDPAPDATYEWSLGDGTVDTGGVSLTYEYELPGGYQVDVTAQNECGEDQFTTIVFDAPTISMPDQQGVIGQTLLVPVLIDGAYQAASFNMNLQFDSPGGSGTEFAIMDIYSTALQEEGPFAWFPVGVNETTVAWSANNFPGVTLQDGDTLFVLELLLFNPGVVPSILDNSEISFYTQDFVLVPLPVNADNGEITIGNGVSAVGDVVMAPYHEQAFQGLPEVGVFFNTDGSSQTEVTGSLGNYFIENLIPGSDYQVYFSRPGNADNGLSTLGILRLLRHLADIDPIDSPYQLIAADADCNEIVEIDDVFTIQDLILNFGEEENEDCPSWKFVDADYVFPNPADPFGYPEVFNLNAAEPVLDLGTTYGMKNGDVVGAANPNRISQLTDTLYLLANNGAFEEGELVEIDFTVAHFNELTGFQLELNFDPSILSFLEVETGAIPGFDIDDFGLTETANGRMRTNWFVSDLMPVSIDDGELAFRIRFTAEANISDVSEVLNLSLSEDFLPEAYNATFEQQALWLIFDAVDNVAEVLWSDGVQLFQNTPNPFTHQTKISFYLPEAMETVLVITDVMGRRVHQFKGRYSQGYHMLDWILEDNLSAGIYHYTLLTGTGQLTRRMVLVK